ncbi:MAG: signal peptidase I [Actinomycetota bacterium]|nr:signal peptidase I [Actinomycetota bacterium]
MRSRRVRLPAQAWRVALLTLSLVLVLALAAGDAFAVQLPIHRTRAGCRLGRAPAPVAVSPITAPPGIKAWNYQYAVAERIMFGLSATRQSIAAAAADPFSSSDDLGTPLTPAEHRQLLAADRFGLHVEAVSRAALTALPGSFAGAWFEYPHRGTIYVAFTSHACPSQRVRERLAQIASGRTVPVAATRNVNVTRLNALAAAVDRDVTKLSRLGVIINRSEIDTPGDRFLVTLDPSSVPRAQAIMRTRYGSRGLAFTRPAPPAQAADAKNDLPRNEAHPSASRDAGAPFLTQAHALARGDFAAACAQFSDVILLGLARTPAAARRVCVRQLRSLRLDQVQRRRVASTRIVTVRVNHRRARVVVQTTLYGLHPRATGIAILEDGRWKILKQPSGAHVGSSLLETIPSGGMIPTLHPGDTILLHRQAYHHAAPAIGDIVVLHPPVGADTRTARCATPPPKGQACATVNRRESKALFIERIVAGPGDRIAIRHGHVIRNGTPASESFIQPCDAQAMECNFPQALTVPAGGYYVLGDNRGNSYDSRYWGPVTAASIIGQAQRVGP